jgi:tRNA U54 and U55 pseudouridine synthase Pus10
MADDTTDDYRVKWDVSLEACPIYLLGRYRKLARDVPQSEWTVTSKNYDHLNDVDDDHANESTGDDHSSVLPDIIRRDDLSRVHTELLKHERKGRYSVEEIVTSAITSYLGIEKTQCRIHPCGREDINVRCLGNGRPFAVQIRNSTLIPGEICCPVEASLLLPLPVEDADRCDHFQLLLDSAKQYVNCGMGLNSEKDVELLLLRVADRSIWETMQAVAEDKRKGYTCLVWSERSLTRRDLQQLERRCNGCEQLDAEGSSCIQVRRRVGRREGA